MADKVRTTDEVFQAHLRESLTGSVDNDLARNYAEDVIVLTKDGACRGHDALRMLARRLREELPNAQFRYTAQVVECDVAFLEWAADTPSAFVNDGADSFVIRDGRIVAQTIHYTVQPRSSTD